MKKFLDSSYSNKPETSWHFTVFKFKKFNIVLHSFPCHLYILYWSLDRTTDTFAFTLLNITIFFNVKVRWKLNDKYSANNNEPLFIKYYKL